MEPPIPRDGCPNLTSIFHFLHFRKDLPDVSAYDFPKTIWYMIPSGEAAIKLVTLVPVIGFGMIGNLILLNIIARNRALQTPTNLILANMVTADTITLLFCPAMFICRDFFQNFVLGAVGCNMEGYLQGNEFDVCGVSCVHRHTHNEHHISVPMRNINYVRW